MLYFHSPDPSERRKAHNVDDMNHNLIQTGKTPGRGCLMSPAGTPCTRAFKSPTRMGSLRVPNTKEKKQRTPMSQLKAVLSPNVNRKQMLGMSSGIMSPAAMLGAAMMGQFQNNYPKLGAHGFQAASNEPRKNVFPSPPSKSKITDVPNSQRRSKKRMRERVHESPNKRSMRNVDWTKRNSMGNRAAFPHIKKRAHPRDLMNICPRDVRQMSSKDEKQMKLREVKKLIDFWQMQMNNILKRSWNQKKEFWIQQAHTLLWKTTECQQHLEPTSAETYPQTFAYLDNALSKEDKAWRHVLIASARITKIISPEFDELIYIPTGPSDPAEFEFHIGFDFGFDCKELSWMIHWALSLRHTEKGLRNLDICEMISEYVGNTKFQSEVLVYFKKSAIPWWEQDGIAKMRTWNPETKRYEDLIEFQPDEQTYYVQRWNEASVLVSDYPDSLDEFFPVDEGEGPKMWRRVMQKKFIASICCQIIHTAIMKTTPPRSVGARNIMKQLAVVLKGWFIGILLGEAFSPAAMKFEYDTRGPSLTPLTIATVTQEN